MVKQAEELLLDVDAHAKTSDVLGTWPHIQTFHRNEIEAWGCMLDAGTGTKSAGPNLSNQVRGRKEWAERTVTAEVGDTDDKITHFYKPFVISGRQTQLDAGLRISSMINYANGDQHVNETFKWMHARTGGLGGKGGTYAPLCPPSSPGYATEQSHAHSNYRYIHYYCEKKHYCFHSYLRVVHA